MEARESQRDLMRLAVLDGPVASETTVSDGTAAGGSPAASVVSTKYLDLSIRHKMQARSTVTSLESLASSIDIPDPADKNFKRKNFITAMDKESQLKEQRHSFSGMFGGDSKSTVKKTRPNEKC